MPEIIPTEIVPQAIKPAKNRYTAGKFYSCSAEVNEKYLTVKLPASLAKYLGATDMVHYHVSDGVLQISGSEPKTAIPISTKYDYIPQAE